MLRYRFFKVFIPCAIVLIFVAGCRDPKILYPSGDIIIDAGDSIPFSSESYPDAIYKWTFDGGAKDALGQNPTVRFDSPGVYFASAFLLPVNRPLAVCEEHFEEKAL